MLRQYKFKLVIAGNAFKGVIDKDLRYLIEEHDWVDFLGHSYRMMCLNLDLAIIPLADLPFNHYKSPIKFYEMSAMGVPSIMSNVEPYSAHLDRQKLAWGYNDAISFEKAVQEAVSKPHLRYEYAENAYNWVYKYRNAKTNVKLWEKAYGQLR